ncbi:MAG: DUF4405 domain-containing protein [Bacteroidales bacterium]|nr:DUF4405 domain-containing protein [Bacteroidales bacterium]
MNFQSLKKFLYLNTYGWIAIAGMLICALSGIFLAIPFDIQQPYQSIALILLTNPAASFFRNIHFWSAQIFFIFTALHIYDHLKRSTEEKISSRVIWFRLTLSLAFVGYVMISGFILKADSDSLQARRILSALIASIPFAGKILNSTFIGQAENWQIVYLHHIATATIIIFIGIYDHVRTIWVNLRTFIICAIAISILSLLFRAPLGTLNDQVMKGPWYFVGIQELLHWISHPWIIVVAFTLLLILLYFLPRLPIKLRNFSKRLLLVLAIVYLALSLVGTFFRGENWKWQWPWTNDAVIKTAFRYNPVTFQLKPSYPIRSVGGQPEGCLDCHPGMKGLSISHSESSTGCYSCHLGDPFTLDKDLAHKGMVIPGNLSNASKTCGTPACHPQIVERVNGSIMTTLSGLIQVDRFAFHETKELNGLASILKLTDSPADLHLKNLCAGCHLGSEKLKTGPAAWLDRGGGCNACHLTYRQSALNDWNKQRKKADGDTSIPQQHPSIDLTIGNTKCKSCHSRSGRISMNYEGWHETSLKQLPETNASKYQQLPDGRVFEFIQEDVHFSRGMSCIDCHSSYDLMGDGKAHSHKEEAVSIACSDCHPEKGATIKSMSLMDADKETQLIAWLRGASTAKTPMLLTQKGGRLLVNTSVSENGNITLKGKLSGSIHNSLPQQDDCSRNKAHQRLSCNSCHTSWAPQCIGCHNSYDSQAFGYGMLNKKSVKGSWVEFTGKYIAEAPVLGVNETDNKIQTYVPGMIMTIDKSAFSKLKKNIFQRLYAPASAHTTVKKSRSCQSCHNNPVALGFGRGSLDFSKNGHWIFDPRFENNPNDGLPEDAWTGFLSERTGVSATRNGHRPFNIKEQRQILLVGSCLTCHPPESSIMKESLNNFSSLLKRRTAKCIMPAW